MPLALADLLGCLPLRDQALPCFLQCDQPVAVSLRHEKCSWIHLSRLTLSIGHFYLARLGHYHLAATPKVLNLAEAAAFVRCSRAHLCNVIHHKVPGVPHLPSVRIGRRV